MFCYCDIEEKGLLLLRISKWLAERQSNESFYIASCGTQSEWGRKPCRGGWTICAIKKRMNNGEGVNRRAGSGRKTVVDFDSLRNAISSGPRTFIRQHARRLGIEAAAVRRAVAKLGTKSLSLWKDHGSRLLSAPSTLNAVRCLLMTSSLLLLEEWSSSYMGKLDVRSCEKQKKRQLLHSQIFLPPDAKLCNIMWQIYTSSCNIM